MSSAQIKMRMEAKSNEMRASLIELGKRHTEAAKEISKNYGDEMFEFNVQLRHAEAAEAEEAYQAEVRRAEAEEAAKWLDGDEEAEGWITRSAEDSEDEEGWNVGLAQRQQAAWEPSPADELCYHCGGEEESCRCAEELMDAAALALDQAEDQEDEPCYDCGRWTADCVCQSRLNAEAEAFSSPHKKGTKLKWVSSTNPETYRVAIVKKDCVLEVKRVTDGAGYCHNAASCGCGTCREIRLSRGRAPIPRPPLVKTFFETVGDWLASLPQRGIRGSIMSTVPAISARQLKKISCTPLSGATDALKLKELQERLPGATIVLNTDEQMLEVEHVYHDIQAYPEAWRHLIYSRKDERSVFHFLDLGSSPRQNGKPQLMAEWEGFFIDLSHLF
jgi:hypothetical protein